MDNECTKIPVPMTEFLLPFLGRMHPVLVHLPIGILIFGILLCFFPQNGKNALLPSIRLAFLIGGIAALAAGGGLVILLESMDPALRGQGAVSEVLGVAPLVTVPVIETSVDFGDRRRRWLLMGIAAIGVLVIALAFLPATLWSDCGVRERDFFSFYFLFVLRG